MKAVHSAWLMHSCSHAARDMTPYAGHVSAAAMQALLRTASAVHCHVMGSGGGDGGERGGGESAGTKGGHKGIADGGEEGGIGTMHLIAHCWL